MMKKTLNINLTLHKKLLLKITLHKIMWTNPITGGYIYQRCFRRACLKGTQPMKDCEKEEVVFK